MTATVVYLIVTLPPITSAGSVPVLELRHLDLDPGPPREVSHPRVGVHAEHRAASRLELPGLDAGAAADVQDSRPGAGGDNPVH